jgi:hypothetical protein
MQAVSSHNRRVTTVETDTGTNRIHNFYGVVGTAACGPQAFLVEMLSPDGRVNPHFHDVDQFQVVVRGSGRLGKKLLQPISFHYADGFSPYGPILDPDGGLSYFTLRMSAAGGHWEMPGSRDKMPGKPGRNIVGRFETGRDRPAAGQSRRECLLPAAPDRLLATGFRLGSVARAEGEASDGGGQYILVCSGALIHEGQAMPPFSLLLVERGEPAPVLRAGPGGADLLVLQFPAPSDRPGSQPRTAAVDYQLPTSIRIG